MKGKKEQQRFGPIGPRPKYSIRHSLFENEDWAEREDRKMLRKINSRPGAWRRLYE